MGYAPPGMSTLEGEIAPSFFVSCQVPCACRLKISLFGEPASGIMRTAKFVSRQGASIRGELYESSFYQRTWRVKRP